MYADSIDSLETDKNAISQSENQLLNSLFVRKSMFETILGAAKEVVLAGILFVIFSLPQVDDLVKKYVPSTNNSVYLLTFVKAALFMFAFFVLKNMYLVRNN
jgi:hypothetical protein